MKRLQLLQMRLVDYSRDRAPEIWMDLKKNHLWQRMLRNTLCTSLTIAVCLVNYKSNPPFGKAAYIAAMISIFSHPGRRVGQLVEAVSLSVTGGFFGVAWALFGIWLSSLVIEDNPSAAFTIRGIMLVMALMFHGFYRSHTPRMFLFVLVFMIEAISGLVSSNNYVTTVYVKQLVYPILLAAAIIFLINVAVFPEFSSAFLGNTTIDALDAASNAMVKAGQYFVETEEDMPNREISNGKSAASGDYKDTPSAVKATRAEVQAMKAKLRSSLASCRSAQNESQFEIAYSHIPPHELSPISKKTMKRLVAHVIAIIGACNLRDGLLDTTAIKEGSNCTSEAEVAGQSPTDICERAGSIDLRLIKPRREIEFGDVELFRELLANIKKPYLDFQGCLSSTVATIVACLAYAYDVPTLPSKAKTPQGFLPNELDVYLTTMRDALDRFDADTTSALESVSMIEQSGQERSEMMPRPEVFLVASFLLNVRQAAMLIIVMLEHCKGLVHERSLHQGWRKLYLPQIQWRKWLYSGGEEEESMPAKNRRSATIQREYAAKQGNKSKGEDEKTPLVKMNPDLESAVHHGPYRGGSRAESSGRYMRTPSKGHDKPNPRLRPIPPMLRLRGWLADILEWMHDSEDLSYAFKLTFAAMLVLFPALIPTLNPFFSQNRGTWAAIQLVLVFDVAIGTSVHNFILRLVGTTLGSLWGWASYAAHDGNPFVCAVMLFVGLIPCAYVQLATKYPKAGQVCMVSMSVVALATELQTVPGTSTEVFLNRWIAFLIGGVVALLIEVILLPVKARTRLVEAVAGSVRRIEQMESFIAYGIEGNADISAGFPASMYRGFDHASSKAKSALSSAETFLPFCSSEPRLKGSFGARATIYKEVIFVLHQIIDNMDNMLQLRREYGSGPLQDFNSRIYPYRRNVAGAVSLVLYAVREALTTKYPLPQFLPSARLAHNRLINRIRDVVQADAATFEAELETAVAVADSDSQNGSVASTASVLGQAQLARQRIWRHKYMSWNAAAGAQQETIEYLEELTDLTKLLVGVSDFRSGMLTRPTFQQYAAFDGGEGQAEDGAPGADEGGRASRLEFRGANDKDDEVEKAEGRQGLGKLRSREKEEKEELPVSLQRIHSRKKEAGLKKRRTKEGSM